MGTEEVEGELLIGPGEVIIESTNARLLDGRVYYAPSERY